MQLAELTTVAEYRFQNGDDEPDEVVSITRLTDDILEVAGIQWTEMAQDRLPIVSSGLIETDDDGDIYIQVSEQSCDLIITTCQSFWLLFQLQS